MNQFFPPPLYKFLKIAIGNGGISANKAKNVFPWLLKTILFEPLRWIEILTQDKSIREHTISHHPIFVLGFYRSGTTYLQQFLLQDDRTGHHSVFQMVFPEIMLSSEKWLTPVMESISSRFNMQDPVHRIPLTWQYSGEEDATMTTSLNTLGAQWGFFFPEKMQHYFDRYVLMENISELEEQTWIQSFVFLLKKISLANEGKQLVLKSPPNTARVKLLHSLFPNAKFILIHRNPYDVFASNKNFWKIAQEIYTIGKTKHADINSIILDMYSKTMSRYIAEKDLIPSEQLIEVPYAEFVDRPLETTKAIYEGLRLDDFGYCKNKMASFAEQQGKFKRLSHSLHSDEKRIVSERWEPYFRHWGYSLS